MPWSSCRPTATVMIVLGGHTIGTAVAIAARRAGYGVVVCDVVDPPWTRRGQSFTNAWYLGNAEVDGEGAQFCASVKTIPSVLERRNMVAATTWSWQGVAAALPARVLVDTRADGDGAMMRNLVPEGLLTVCVGRADDGAHLHVATDDVGDEGRIAAVTASGSGRFATARRIGDRVLAGETVGAIGNASIMAPCAGVLLGLSARGARVTAGQRVVEVDPAGIPARCFQSDARSCVIAERVTAALAAVALPEPAR